MTNIEELEASAADGAAPSHPKASPPPGSLAGGPTGEGAPAALTGEEGMATAEYAIVTLAAAGFAGLLAVILRNPEIREAITSIIRSALSG